MELIAGNLLGRARLRVPQHTASLKQMIAGVVCMHQIMRMKVSAILAICLAPLCVHAGQAGRFAELRQPGKPALKVRMTEPVVVAVASRPEKWGFFQFPGKEQVSCGYTSLLATGPDRCLIIYSDFKYPTPAGEIRKAIKVCELIVTLDSARRLRAPKWSD